MYQTPARRHPASMEQTAERTTLRKFVEGLRARGFETKAIVSDVEMAAATEAFDAEEGVLDTPAEELRYIEGLLNLPIGHLERFRIIPTAEHARCACGRVPSALDLVATTVRRRIHDRDTLLGLTNLVELADNGRAGECVSCGRRMVSKRYWTNRYMYA